MLKYYAEYKILDRHYAIEHLDIPLRYTPHDHWRCVVDGVSCDEKHKSLAGAERQILALAHYYLNEDWHTFDKARELCSRTSAELEKGRGKLGPKVNSLIPFMVVKPEEEPEEKRVRPKIDVRLFDHHDCPHIIDDRGIGRAQSQYGRPGLYRHTHRGIPRSSGPGPGIPADNRGAAHIQTQE